MNVNISKSEYTGNWHNDPDRNKWIVSAYVNGGNLYAVINYCPMCGRKLNEVSNG